MRQQPLKPAFYLRLLQLVDGETAHRMVLAGIKLAGLTALRSRPSHPPIPALSQHCLGLHWQSPIGLAAGFDKNATVFKELLRLGFGSVEVGTVTPEPQKGKARPRIFRLHQHRAIINRMGFPNDGMQAARRRLKAHSSTSHRQHGLVGINIGCNGWSQNRIADYGKLARGLAAHGDYLAVNVSSPNTPGLRSLQHKEHLAALMDSVREGLAEAGYANKPVLIKIAPDQDDVSSLAEALMQASPDGVILGNTTLERPDYVKNHACASKAGGLSGRPLFQPSTIMLAKLWLACDRQFVFIGTGGVEDGRTAYAKICAGASLIQLYSALCWAGPALVGRIEQEFVELLRQDGFSSLSQAVGHRAHSIARGELS
ncbi:MAG: quinone-dependent dihydroorotate dehydrogenase [Pseudomonadota bacterium]